jgi:hypothetical protein
VADNILVQRSATLVEVEVDHELVALDVGTGTCFGFNPPAAAIWALIEEPKTVDAIRDSLLDQFDVDPVTCETEVLSLLKQLEADGLITTATQP